MTLINFPVGSNYIDPISDPSLSPGGFEFTTPKNNCEFLIGFTFKNHVVLLKSGLVINRFDSYLKLSADLTCIMALKRS